MDRVHIIQPTNQIRGLHTIIRNKDCPRAKFIFYSDRLIRLLIEGALNFLPVEEKTVTTPTGCTYEGIEWTGRIVGVPILRSGEAMEAGLREVCNDVRIGKILIQRNEEDAQPKLFYCKMPKDIAERYVLLLDPMLATGGSAACAIKLLIEEHGVQEDHIIFCNLLAAPEGIKKLMREYPKITIVTTEIDEKLNDTNYILPGLGDFGDRYFGTI